MQRILSLLLFLLFITCLYDEAAAQSKGGRWQFENNGDDTADWDDNDDVGSLVDTASFGQENPLQEGIAYLWLDITRSYNFFKVDDNDDLDFTDENIGLSAWIYPVQLTDVQFFITKGTQNTNPKTTNYALRISKSKNLEFLIRDASNKAQTVASTFKVSENQWTFVAAFYDFDNNKVYLWNNPSSAPADTLDFNQGLFANDGPLAIGAWYVDDAQQPSTANFKGRIDDVRISGRMEDIVPNYTSIENQKMIIVREPVLKQNYPNPFNPVTNITFTMPESQNVVINIYDTRGIRVTRLLDEVVNAGSHDIQWDGGNLASGIYYCQLVSGGSVLTKCMLLLK